MPAGIPSPPPWPPQTAAAGRSRRRQRQSITFLIVFGLVLALGLVAYGAFEEVIPLPFSRDAVPTTSACPSAAAGIQPAALTQVRVYNAGDRRGLAQQVARVLQRRKFQVPAIGNDPMESKPTVSAVIRYGAAGLVAAQTVATQVASKVSLEQDDRIGEVVDLVLGPAFTLLDDKKAAAVLKAAPAARSCAAVG